MATSSSTRGRSSSKIREDGREMIGIIQTSGIHRIRITAAPRRVAAQLPPGEDHRELHLELCEDGQKPKETPLSRGMAEALIGLLRAGVETL